MTAFEFVRCLNRRVFFFRGYAQAFFFFTLILYTWFYPSYRFEKTWLDDALDVIGISCLIVGEALRIWAVSHAGKCTRSRRLKAPILVTTGPYSYVRHPIYLGNLLIGLGLVVLSQALVFVPIFSVLFALHYGAMISAEENFLKEKFGSDFDGYRARVAKFFPFGTPRVSSLTFGANFPLKEFGTLWGTIFGGFVFEWIESPRHRQWILSLYHWLAKGIT